METAIHIANILLPYLAVGAGLTVLTQIVKRVSRLERTSVILLLFHTLTFLATLATWWVNHAMALYTLVLHGTAYSGAASALYPAVRWLDGKITSFYKTIQLAKKYEPELEAIAQKVEEDTGVDLGVPAENAPAVPDLAPAQNTNKTPPAANF